MKDLSASLIGTACKDPAGWKLREPMNGLTHCIGAVLAFIGFVILIREAAHPYKPWHLTAFAVYGTSMVLLYATSTIFHWVPLENDETSMVRRLDHIMIFIFIGGSYTPFCLIPLRELCGWSILTCIWTLAALGGVSKLFWIQSPPWATVLVYLILGYFALFCIGPLAGALQREALFWVFAGGAFYTIGGLIYAIERPDPLPRLFGFHEIFHIFVMLGSTAHFWAIYRYLTVLD